MQQLVYSPKSLGQFIRRVRKFRGLTQNQIGITDLRVDQTTVSSIERGAEGTRIGTLFRLFAVLGLEVEIRDKDDPDSQVKLDW